jgi:hypothetical protein
MPTTSLGVSHRLFTTKDNRTVNGGIFGGQLGTEADIFSVLISVSLASHHSSMLHTHPP